MAVTPRRRRHLAGFALVLGVLGGPVAALPGLDVDDGRTADHRAQRVPVDEVRLRGLEGEEADNVRLAVGLMRLSRAQRRELTEARLGFLLRRLPKEVATALEPFGWYRPTVVVDREDGPEGLQIVVTVDRGAPVRVKALSAIVSGAGGEDRFVTRVAAKAGPAVGERLVHADYEAGKARVEAKLAERGYFKARRTANRVAVRREDDSADITLAWDSGPRHAMGEARFGPNGFRPGLLAPLVDWAPGDPYHEAKLQRLQRRLAALDYFALVEVAAAESEAEASLQVPIDITTTPAKRTAYVAAVSFGSDSGLGLRGGIQRRWVNDRGHKWSADAEWAERASAFATHYRLPSLRRLPGWWGGEVAYRAEDPDAALGYARTTASVGWQGQREPWTVTAKLVGGRERARSRLRLAGLEGRQQLLYPELALAYRETDDPLFPERGRAATARLRLGAFRADGERLSFAQVDLGAQWLIGFGERHRLLLRGQAGSTALGEGDLLLFPTSLRFFAGGDRSLRGYGYREVGPRIGGQVVGGLHTLVGSVEYQHFFRPAWGAAVFLDAGDAFNSREAFDPKLGAGVGVRWRSPVGLVAVDLAHGFDAAAGGGTRLHVGFGVGF